MVWNGVCTWKKVRKDVYMIGAVGVRRRSYSLRETAFYVAVSASYKTCNCSENYAICDRCAVEAMKHCLRLMEN